MQCNSSDHAVILQASYSTKNKSCTWQRGIECIASSICQSAQSVALQVICVSVDRAKKTYHNSCWHIETNHLDVVRVAVTVQIAGPDTAPWSLHGVPTLVVHLYSHITNLAKHTKNDQMTRLAWSLVAALYMTARMPNEIE